MEDSLFAIWQKNPTLETLDVSKKLAFSHQKESNESRHYHAYSSQDEKSQNGKRI